MIKGEILKIAQQGRPLDSGSWLDRYLILRSSIIMEWQEIIDTLSKNINYLARILYLIEKHDVAE